MAKGNTVLLLAGASALLLLSGKKKKSKVGDSPAAAPEDRHDDDLDDEDSIFDPEDIGPDIEPDSEPDNESVIEPVIKPPTRGDELLARHMDPSGKAQLGMLYQVTSADRDYPDAETHLKFCLEALFGDREIKDPYAIDAAKKLHFRVQCSPWNSVLYHAPSGEAGAGWEAHAGDDEEASSGLIYFHPMYVDNQQRIRDGLKPGYGRDLTIDQKKSYPLIWIPMINLDRFDEDGTVTLEGMYHPDTEHGIGGSMIDPPDEILRLGFEDISTEHYNGFYGCELVEGDFRKKIVQD